MKKTTRTDKSWAYATRTYKCNIVVRARNRFRPLKIKMMTLSLSRSFYLSNSTCKKQTFNTVSAQNGWFQTWAQNGSPNCVNNSKKTQNFQKSIFLSTTNAWPPPLGAWATTHLPAQRELTATTTTRTMKAVICINTRKDAPCIAIPACTSKPLTRLTRKQKKLLKA